MMPEEKPIIFYTGLIPAIQNLKPNTWENNPYVWVYEFMRTEARP